MSGGGVRPLCSLFHLFSLSVLASPDDSDALCRSPAGVGLLNPRLGQIANIHAHSDVSVNACTNMYMLTHSHKWI